MYEGVMKKNKLFFLILLSLIITLRIYFLDADLPPWKIANTSIKDEGYYAIQGLINYHIETKENQKDQEDLRNELHFNHSLFYLFQNCFIYLTLKMFGNNYYGLKFSFVVAYLIFILILYNLIAKIINELKDRHNKIKQFLFIGSNLLILLNFHLFTTAMTTEQMIWRLLFLSFNLLLFYYLLQKNILHRFLSILVLGFLSTFSTLFIYPYNAFILPSILLTIILTQSNNNFLYILKNLFYYVVGIAICLLLFHFVLQLTIGESAFQSLSAILSTGRNIGILLFGAEKPIHKMFYYLYNVYSIFSTNIFRFNIGLLLIFLILIPINIYRITKLKSKFDLFLILLLIFFSIQTFFVNNSPYRKGIILLPIIVLTILYGITTFKEFLLFTKKKSNKYYITYLIYVMAVFLFSGLVVYMEFFFKWPEHILIGKLKDDFIITYQLIAIPLILISTFIIINELIKNNLKITRYLKYIIIIMLLFPNLYLFSQYFSNISYSQKEIRMDIDRRVGKYVVAGGWNYGYWIYTDFKPKLNFYKYIHSKRMDKYYELLDSIFKNEKNVFVIIDDLGISKEMENLFFHSQGLKFKVDTFYVEKDYKTPNPKYRMMLYKKEIELPNQEKIINQ